MIFQKRKRLSIFLKVCKEGLQKTFSRFGIEIISSASLARLKNSQEGESRLKSEIEFRDKMGTKAIPRIELNELFKIAGESKAQLFQDLIALYVSEFKVKGYFVEFGATDGITLSNTYLLEKNYGWSGILAEPGKLWHKNLFANRKAYISTKCVWRDSGQLLEFNETSIGELSTLEVFSNSDTHSVSRISEFKYQVETITLLELLEIHSAPEVIDYISIDTEGSEYEILSAFDFDKFRFRFISCEHNFTSSQEYVYNLLTSHGYVRVFEDVSRFDDWYVHPELVEPKRLI